MALSNKVRVLCVLAGVLVISVAAVAWAMWPEVDDIPEVLDEISDEVSIADLSLDAQGSQPAVRVGDLRGQTVFLMIEGRESMTGGEGRQLHRAIYRWTLPEDVVALSIGDAPAGAALMRKKIESDFLGPMRDEMKYPIYIDYGGQFTEALALPKGHLGIAVIDPAGELVFRHAGDTDEATLAELQALLGAIEPQPGPPAPSFAVGELDNHSCAGHPCVLVFLDAKVTRAEIPGLDDGGFEGDMKASFEQIKQPSVRLARAMSADWEAEEREGILGVIVGEGEGWEVEGWGFAVDGEGAREAFGIGDAAGMVIVDEQGRVALNETGVIPFWKLGLAAELLGIEPKAHQGRGAR